MVNCDSLYYSTEIPVRSLFSFIFPITLTRVRELTVQDKEKAFVILHNVQQ